MDAPKLLHVVAVDGAKANRASESLVALQTEDGPLHLAFEPEVLNQMLFAVVSSLKAVTVEVSALKVALFDDGAPCLSFEVAPGVWLGAATTMEDLRGIRRAIEQLDHPKMDPAPPSQQH